MRDHHPITYRPEGVGAPPPVLVVMAASAGGLAALTTILSELPAGLPAAIAIVQHRTAAHPWMLGSLLERRCALTVVQVREQPVAMRSATVYLAPPDRHLLVTAARQLEPVAGPRVRFQRSSANPLFESAAAVYGRNVIAVVLTGGDSDGTDGVQSVTAHGGTVIAQDPATAQFPGMPSSAIATRTVSAIVPLGDIAPTLVQLVQERLLLDAASSNAPRAGSSWRSHP